MCALTVLVQVDSVAEGEAQRYFDHAITLRDTILFLRYNRNLGLEPGQVPAKGLGEYCILRSCTWAPSLWRVRFKIIDNQEICFEANSHFLWWMKLPPGFLYLVISYLQIDRNDKN